MSACLFSEFSLEVGVRDQTQRHKVGDLGLEHVCLRAEPKGLSTKKMPTDLRIGQSDRGIFSIEFLIAYMSLTCANLTATKPNRNLPTNHDRQRHLNIRNFSLFFLCIFLVVSVQETWNFCDYNNQSHK